MIFIYYSLPEIRLAHMFVFYKRTDCCRKRNDNDGRLVKDRVTLCADALCHLFVINVYDL